MALTGYAHAQGRQTVRLENPFAAPHRLQPVLSVLTITKDLLPNGRSITIESLNRYVGLQDQVTGNRIPVQWSDLQSTADGDNIQATANYITDLPAQTVRSLKLTGPLTDAPSVTSTISVDVDDEHKAVEVRTGRLGVRLAAEGSQSPPLLAICRLPKPLGDGPTANLPWHGRSVFANTPVLEGMTVQKSATGPVFYRQTNTYRFALGTVYKCTVTCWSGIDYVTIEESIDGPASERMRWTFDLENWPTHVYTAGHGATQKLVNRRHSSAYLDFPLAELDPGHEFLWLPNYLIWSRFEEALLANFVRSTSGPGGQPPFDSDMLTVFQIRRGEWEDRMWAARSRRPLGDTPWRPWSQRRWWGSRFGTIRVARNGHQKSGALLKFSLAPGTRSWGLAVGDSATLPPARKMVFDAPLPSHIKTSAGEVRLTELQHFILDWRADPKVKHPRMDLTPDTLRTMQQKARTDPYFANELESLEKNDALRAVLENDPKAAAAIARGILGDMSTRFNFPLNDGFEFSSHLTPVGIRPVYQYATKIDLLLGGKDLLEPEIQKQLRERFVFLAYLLADSSFMAHKYNAGHPNFDADRYVTLAGIAMLYPDHPHSQQWLDSAVGSLREAMRIYVIPGSGKWAENLGGYYNWSTNIIGGLANALKHSGSADPYAWPEFQDFWRWGLVTGLPPKPAIGSLGGDTTSEKLTRVRQTPGIGDNGGDGGLGVHGGFALAGANMLEHNPELGRQLLWFWDQGGRVGYGHYPYAMFFGLTAEHLRLAREPDSSPRFESRVLQGYGSIFRTEFGRPSESYLLFKCGPGGYRYHGEEGSFVLFGHGQPLALDGGRSFRPEEHSTVTFGQENTGLLRGRIVQFESTPQLDYSSGRFPGTPTQLPQTTTQSRSRGDVSGFSPLVTAEDGTSDGSLSASNIALHEEGDVMSRQILFRKNDYVVIRDRIDSVQAAQWRLLLLVQELKRSRQGLDGRGWLDVDVAVSLFELKSNTLQPVSTQRVVIDEQPLKQQRMTLPLSPGTGLVAVIDFFKRGKQPWRVQAKGTAVVLTAASGKAREVVELWGDTRPQARWQQFQGAEEVAAWSSSQYDDPWPVTRTAVLQDGNVYVSGLPRRNDDGTDVVPCPVGKAGEAAESRADLRRYQAGIAALQKAGLWNMLALGQHHLGVVEPDQLGGLQYKEIRDAGTSAAMNGRVEQTLRNKLPSQIAVIRTGNAPRHHVVSLTARRTLSQWAGYAVHEMTMADVIAGKLEGFDAAALFQVTAEEFGGEVQESIRDFVRAGGTLLCDLPTLPSEDTEGATSDWSKFLGPVYSRPNPRGRFALSTEKLGYVELRSADADFLKLSGGKDLGHWFIRPAKAASVVRDVSGRSTVVTHPFGQGNVITLCFRVTSVGVDTTNQTYFAKLLRRVLSETKLKPLVDSISLEMTILPQDEGGLFVGLHNSSADTIHTPLRLPHHSAASITPIYVPFGGSVSVDHIVLPPRSWIVFGVK
jgi:hypothetical protein